VLDGGHQFRSTLKSVEFFLGEFSGAVFSVGSVLIKQIGLFFSQADQTSHSRVIKSVMGKGGQQQVAFFSHGRCARLPGHEAAHFSLLQRQNRKESRVSAQPAVHRHMGLTVQHQRVEKAALH